MQWLNTFYFFYQSSEILSHLVTLQPTNTRAPSSKVVVGGKKHFSIFGNVCAVELWRERSSRCGFYNATSLLWIPKFKWTIPGLLFLYFRLFNSWQLIDMFPIKIGKWLDLNRGPLLSESTALPTEPQPLTLNSKVTLTICTINKVGRPFRLSYMTTKTRHFCVRLASLSEYEKTL